MCMYLVLIYFGSSIDGSFFQHAVRKEDERLVLPFIQVTVAYFLFKTVWSRVFERIKLAKHSKA